MKSRNYISIILIFSLFIFSCNDNSSSKGNQIGAKVGVTKEGSLIPRSSHENARYYLISKEATGELLKTLHKRVSSMSVGYSLTLIDCNSKKYKDLGYGENTKANLKLYDKTSWSKLVSGSSKYDLVHYACNNTQI